MNQETVHAQGQISKQVRWFTSQLNRGAGIFLFFDIIQEIGFHLLPLQPVGGRLFFTGLRLHSSSFRNEAGNPGFHHNIKPVSRLDSFINLLHGLFRQGGDFKVLPDVIGVC